MSLYVPRHFASDDRADALALIRTAPFATLITSSDDAEPHVTHLPLLLLDDREDRLTGHMARANPHWQAFADGSTIAIFHGPHAYISPRWYVEPAAHVPTWNFAVVHVHGRPALVDGAAARLAIVDATTAAFEPLVNPWRRSVGGDKLDAMLDHIVAFELPLTRLQAKFKMSQNRTPLDRAKVADALRAAAHPELAAMADWMEQHEPR